MKPVSRRELIRRLRALGFEGPFSGGSHPHMRKGRLKVTIPNEHTEDIGVPLLKKILLKGRIIEKAWDQAAK